MICLPFVCSGLCSATSRSINFLTTLLIPSSPNQNALENEKKKRQKERKKKKKPYQQSQGENLLSTVQNIFPGRNQQQNQAGSKPFLALPQSQTRLSASSTSRWPPVAHPLVPLMTVPPLIRALLSTLAHFFRGATNNPLHPSHLTLPGSFLLQHLHTISQLRPLISHQTPKG